MSARGQSEKPGPIRFGVFEADLAARTLRKSGDGRRSTATGYGFRVEFPEPVRGPIAVGYGAHFGLGVFAPGE